MDSDALVIDVSQDRAIARDVQQRFMRGRNPAIDNLEYCAQCRQVLELGGDCYDFVPLPNNRLDVAVGDASCKGLAAALMISNAQSSLRTAALLTASDGVAALQKVNRQVHASSLTKWMNSHKDVRPMMQRSQFQRCTDAPPMLR